MSSLCDNPKHHLGCDCLQTARLLAGTSQSLNGPDGRTSSIGKALATSLNKAANKEHPVSRVHQEGYGPAVFHVDIGDHLMATVTVEVKRVGGDHES